MTGRDQPPAATLRDAPFRDPIATLEDVDIRHELEARRCRVPDYEREQSALARLAAHLAENPRDMLQKLAEIAADVCAAHSAGVSLVEGESFRWEAIAGVYASSRGHATPRNGSPCGICIDHGLMQLMYLPDRCFPALFAEPRFVETLLVPFHDHGKPLGVVWLASHSESRHFDREDGRIVRVLAGFASAACQLWSAQETACEAGLKTDAVLATLGHELRNPLAAITAATANLQRHISRSDPEAGALDVIARQAHHITRLADDLLDAGRSSIGKMRLEMRSLNLWGLVLEVVETWRAKIERKGVVLDIAPADAVVWISGDPIRLTQVLSNLLDNALKNTPAGGRITLDGRSAGGEARVSISDTGGGISADQIQRIFEPFTQFGPEGSSGGLGLGLSLVQSLVKLHGGTVSVFSAGLGQGSSFTIHLPLAVPGRDQ